LEQTGLLYDVLASALSIDEGRKGFAIPGKERQGRISYENGVALAMSAFQEAQKTAEAQTIIFAELFFLNQELQFCNAADSDTRGSLTHAIHNFNDALRSLEVVEDAAAYQNAEKTHSTDPKKQVQGFPADVFHQACGSHQTRLRNVLRAPGIEMLEKALLKQRAANMKTAQGAYVEKQRKALSQ
jgi:hypothetical protein